MNRIGSFGIAFVLLACLLGTGCARKIGDGCASSTDCDPNGGRVCDLSQAGGYCTIDGCDDKSCPEDSVCIRTFPEKYLSKLEKHCDPKCEDANCGGTVTSTCLCAGAGTDDCIVDELCVEPGLCARRAFERRYCARTCGDNGDCRSGYECHQTGENGNIALLPNLGATAGFCAQVAD